MNTVTAEIFAVGKWNGDNYTKQALKEIAAAFDKLSEVHKVPLKFGHNNQQPMTDGQPALGWVDKVWVEGDKLMAKFTDVPDVVKRAFDRKLYRKVSIELDIDVDYKGMIFARVLSGVALLGADIPAVSTLADLNKFLASRQIHGAQQRNFTAITNEPTNEDSDMDLTELTKSFNRLEGQFSTLQEKHDALAQQNAELQTANKELTDKTEKFERDEKARLDKEAADKVVFARKAITDLLEEGVKSGKLLPAQRENYTKLLRVDDDAAVVAINIDELRSTIGVSQKQQFNRGSGTASSSGNADNQNVDESPDLIVAKRAKKYAREQKVDYSVAVIAVLEDDSQLATAYRDHNDEEA